MLLNNGVRILSPEAVTLMSQDQLPDTITPKVQEAFAFKGDGVGWSLACAIVTNPVASGWAASAGTITWGGLGGTWFWIDPKNDLFFLGMVQRAADIPPDDNLIYLSNQAVYQALTHPAKYQHRFTTI